MSTILVIDDEPVVRAFLRRVLEADGYSVVEAKDGAEGVNVHETVRPDLVITDIVMPEQDGLETIQALRAVAHPVPIIAMSGRFGDDFLGFAEDFGAVGTLPKPFTVETIRAAVERAFATAASD